MAEEQKTTDEITPPGDAGQGKSQETFDKADYTRKTQRLSAIEQEATDAGYDDPVQFVKDMRRIAEEASTNRNRTTEEPEKKPPVETKDNAAELLRQLSMDNMRLQLNQMRLEHNQDQKELPPEEQILIKHDVLMNYVAEPENARAIANVAAAERKAGKEGNWATIAARMMKKEKLAAEVLKEGEKSDEATARAAAGVKVVTSEAPEAPPKAEKNLMQKRADKIAPDTLQKFD